jgi:hypothetical protein
MADPVLPGWRVERETRDKLVRVASKAGISTSELIDLIVENLPLTDQGIPPWMPPLSRDGELPIDSA